MDRRLKPRPNRLLGGLLFAGMCWLVSCGKEQTEPTGGETHFLSTCDASASACGTTLSCICGVCTLPCDDRSACGALPDAACVASSDSVACGAAHSGGHCDVPCVADVDCAVLSPEHQCRGGFCRVGTAPSPASGGSAGAAGAGGNSGVCEPSGVTANQVLVIGDSFFAQSHQITAYLEERERVRGVLSAGERYRDNSSLLGNALALNGKGILDQYTRGLAEAPVKVVIMNGGGADALLTNCAPDASCQAIVAAASAAHELFAQMATDGIENVVYVAYPEARDTTVRARVDVLRPMIEQECNGSPVPCHWLDLRPVFAGHDSDYVMADGMNPTAAGAQATADAIGALMEDACIAQ